MRELKLKDKIIMYLNTHPMATRDDLAREFNVSIYTINTSCRRHNICTTRKKKALPKEGTLSDKIIKCYYSNPNLSGLQIARLVGAKSRSQVYDTFRRYGIK